MAEAHGLGIVSCVPDELLGRLVFRVEVEVAMQARSLDESHVADDAEPILIVPRFCRIAAVGVVDVDFRAFVKMHGRLEHLRRVQTTVL